MIERLRPSIPELQTWSGVGEGDLDGGLEGIGTVTWLGWSGDEIINEWKRETLSKIDKILMNSKWNYVGWIRSAVGSQ